MTTIADSDDLPAAPSRAKRLNRMGYEVAAIQGSLQKALAQMHVKRRRQHG